MIRYKCSRYGTSGGFVKAMLEEVTVGVDIGKGQVLIRLKPPQSKMLVAHLVHSYMISSEVRRQCFTIPLQSHSFLAANDELREILRKLGVVRPSCFYYTFPDSPDTDRGIMIEDSNPNNHTDICIDGLTPFRKGDPEAAVFFETLAKSPYFEPNSLCRKEQPSNSELLQIHARLKQKYANARLETYQALAELF